MEIEAASPLKLGEVCYIPLVKEDPARFKGKEIIIPTFEGKIVKKTVAIIRICTGGTDWELFYKSAEYAVALCVEENERYES